MMMMLMGCDDEVYDSDECGDHDDISDDNIHNEALKYNDIYTLQKQFV